MQREDTSSKLVHLFGDSIVWATMAWLQNVVEKGSRGWGKEKQKAAGWLPVEPAGEWAEHSAVQRQDSHVPHYRVTKSKFYAASFLGCLETQLWNKHEDNAWSGSAFVGL